jgi:thiol-disulfide isomerase/thioredoxin
MNKIFSLMMLLILLPTLDLFSKSDDVIRIKAIRQAKNTKPESFVVMSVKDGRFWDQVYPVISGIPDSLTDVKTYYSAIDNVQALYQAFRAGVVEKKDFDYYIKAWGSDTTGCCRQYVKTHVVIVSGISPKGVKYYLVDTNNNYSFADEIPVGEIIQSSPPVKILIEKNRNGKVIKDSTWIVFRELKMRMDEIRMGLNFSEFSSGTFQLSSADYQIRAFPAHGNYREGTTFEVLTGTGSQKFSIGEFFKVNNSLYKIDCSPDGLEITLTKVLKNEGSTQAGMPPISFKAKTLKGENINFPGDFKGKYVLLDFWATSCGPCVMEMRDYYVDIYKKYGGKEFEIIGVADNTADELKKFVGKNPYEWMIIPDGELKTILKKYRINSFPSLFLINPEGVIISKNSLELRNGKFELILKENILKD